MKPNIIFILVDSLRADKFYTNENIETPSIDLLIKKGISFNNAFSSSDYTITGYGSIFTGMYPINAGIEGMSYHNLFNHTPNLITKLQSNGYHCYATIDSGMTEIGFNVKFENNDVGYDRTTSNLFEGLEEKILQKFSSGDFSQPWFYFLHLDDLHIPVRIPSEFPNKTYSERYDLVIEKLDRFLGNLLKTINFENTLLVITSDHGDYLLSENPINTSSFGIKSKIRSKIPRSTYNSLSTIKRGTQNKIKKIQTTDSLDKRNLETRTAQNRYLFDDLVHIPLLFFGHGINEIGSVPNFVRSIDISPTILDLLDIESNFLNIDGISLNPIFNGKNVEISSIYLENTIFETDTKNPKPCVGIRTPKYKYFRSLSNPNEKIHLFDIITDPLEKHNISSKNHELVKQMESELLKQRSFLQKRFEKPEMTDEETKKVEEELKKLGYI